MTRLTRRSFLAASAAAAAAAGAAGAAGAAAAGPAPKRGAPGASEPAIEVAIVGAGAAGIAAARRIVAAGRKCVLLEAASSVGGRCLTDGGMFGVPFDRGARWLHSPETNPVAKLATQSGLDLYPAPPGQRVRIGRRYARESEMEDLLAALARANIAITDAARKADTACAQALPKDLGEWRATVEFMLGPFAFGRDLADVSTVDFARSAERDVNAFCRQGVGTLVARLAGGLPVRLATPVTRIAWSGRAGIALETAAGNLTARMAIVTASTGVLSAGGIAFAPELPPRQRDAIARLRLGSRDHIALELPGNPLGLRTDELVFEKSSGVRTAALLGNLAGSTLCTVDVGGRFGRELAAQGEDAMVAFALDWLAGFYGSDVKRALGRSHATRWDAEPWVLGAASVAVPGGQSARRVLMEPLAGRLWFAGEAVHERLFGTVGGAWDSGERAADAVLRALAGPPPRPEPKRPKQVPKRRPGKA
jgi:monoamine oxidase